MMAWIDGTCRRAHGLRGFAHPAHEQIELVPAVIEDDAPAGVGEIRAPSGVPAPIAKRAVGPADVELDAAHRADGAAGHGRGYVAVEVGMDPVVHADDAAAGVAPGLRHRD